MTSVCEYCKQPIHDNETILHIHGKTWHAPCRHLGEVQMIAAADDAGEDDPTGRRPGDPGAKLDAGKAPIMRGCVQYFPLALEAIAEVSAYGASKYTWKGWESVPNGVDRYGDAMLRHILKECHERKDADTGLDHAAHAAWNALARLELMLRKATP